MLRQLIVNADDFGLSAGVNRGIIEAHERGIVTSASLMVRGVAAQAAAEYANARTGLGVGLHLDLAEWIYRDNAWSPLYEVVDLADRVAVESEVRKQLDAFIGLMGRSPSHVDSHQHMHRDEPLRSIAQRLTSELNVPLRHFSAVQYCGHFYGQTAKGEPALEAISADALLELLRRLPPGITELACHPGYADDIETAYCAERACEIQALCDPRVQCLVVEQRIDFIDFSVALR
jgi:predicted glycoside hydrolase/deacetylase ChbG (UPF0249 family)